MGALRCTLLSFSEFNSLSSSHTWKCFFPAVFQLFLVSPVHQHCVIFSGTLQHVCLHCSQLPPHHLLANASLPPHLCLKIFQPFSSLPLTSSSVSSDPSPLLAHFPRPLPFLIRSEFSNETWEVFLPEELNFFTVFCYFLSILSVFKNPTSSLLHLRIPGSFIGSHSLPICTSPSEESHASGGVVIFVRQSLFSAELSISPFSSLDPYSDYFTEKLFSILFLKNLRSSNLLSLTDSRIDIFSFSVLPSSRNLLIMGNFNCPSPL